MPRKVVEETHVCKSTNLQLACLMPRSSVLKHVLLIQTPSNETYAHQRVADSSEREAYLFEY